MTKSRGPTKDTRLSSSDRRTRTEQLLETIKRLLAQEIHPRLRHPEFGGHLAGLRVLQEQAAYHVSLVRGQLTERGLHDRNTFAGAGGLAGARGDVLEVRNRRVVHAEALGAKRTRNISRRRLEALGNPELYRDRDLRTVEFWLLNYGPMGPPTGFAPVSRSYKVRPSLPTFRRQIKAW